MTSWQRLPSPVDLFRNVNACSILPAHSPAPSLLVMDEKPPLTAGDHRHSSQQGRHALDFPSPPVLTPAWGKVTTESVE